MGMTQGKIARVKYSQVNGYGSKGDVSTPFCSIQWGYRGQISSIPLTKQTTQGVIMNYNVTQCHNSIGNGEDIIPWWNIEVYDLTEHNKDRLLFLVKQIYKEELEYDKVHHKFLNIEELEDNR